MKRGNGKVALLLAGADLSDRDLRVFAELVMELGPSEFSKRIVDIRRHADELDRNTRYVVQLDIEQPEYGNLIDETAERVERLLILEAGLPKGLAAELLLNEIYSSEEGRALSIPSLGKTSFHKWVKRVSVEIPGSQILHFATVIRNKSVHSSQSDWPLRTDS